MVNTAEFWVGISFIVCVGISFKLIIPTIKSSLGAYQKSIEQEFLEAEHVLVAARRKFAGAKNQFDTLPQLAQIMARDLDAEINQKLSEWKLQQDGIVLKHQQTQEHKVQSLKNHSGAQIYSIIVQAVLNLIEGSFKKSFDSKAQQEMILVAIKQLPKI